MVDLRSSQDLVMPLRVVPYQDRHQIITALSRERGKITAIALNSIHSRRFGGTLQPFSVSLWTMASRKRGEFYRIEEADLKKSFSKVQESFELMSLASVFIELILRVAPEDERAPELFQLLFNGLSAVESLPGEVIHLNSLLNAFLLKILQWSGTQPSIHSCRSCDVPLIEDSHLLAGISNPQEDPELTCLVSEAGWICPKCRAETHWHLMRNEFALSIPATGLLDLYAFTQTPIRQCVTSGHASEHTHELVTQYLLRFMLFHLPGTDRSPLRSLKFVDSKAAQLFSTPTPLA